VDNSGKRNAILVQLRKPRHRIRTFAAALVFLPGGTVAQALSKCDFIVSLCGVLKMGIDNLPKMGRAFPQARVLQANFASKIDGICNCG
jgi:hypothetical protein